ncbi:hypothetical protein HDR63_03160 [bacterium]|nr:hypothetical protein [bacterium]
MKIGIVGLILGICLGTTAQAAGNWQTCTTAGNLNNFTACTATSCADLDGYQCDITISGYTKELNKPVASGARVAYAVVNTDTRTVSALVYTYDSCPSGYDKQSITLKSVANTSLGCCRAIGTYNGHDNDTIYTCVKKECAAGTYGDGVTCTACPTPGTSYKGATAKTSCYITGGTDTTGTYTHTSNCYYSN